MNNTIIDTHAEPIENLERFALGGKAIFTLVSKKTGSRFTYKVIRAKARSEGLPAPGLWFVSVLTGANNESDYAYLGTISMTEDGATKYNHGRKSTISQVAPSARAFAWSWLNLVVLPGSYAEKASTLVEVWHEGRCGRCGRKLTTPESLASGFGPECSSKNR